MEKVNFEVDKKHIEVFFNSSNAKTIFLLSFRSEIEEIYELIKEQFSKSFNLVEISNINWDDELSPWPIPQVTKWDNGFKGEADKFINVLENDVFNSIKSKFGPFNNDIAIVGYSLAGLFSIYSGYNTSLFNSLISISGSLWYPDFVFYVLSHELKDNIKYIYLSLGDKEPLTSNKIMKEVGNNTLEIFEHYKEVGMNSIFEWNNGGHFNNEKERIVKGILSFLNR